MDINALKTTYGGLMDTEEVQREFEAHRVLILEHPKTTIRSIDTFLAYRHQGDFTGFLDSLGISRKYHKVLIMINRWTSPSDINDKLERIIVPDVDVIDSIFRLIRSKKK